MRQTWWPLRLTISGIGAVVTSDVRASKEKIIHALPGIRSTTPREAR